PVTGSVFTQLAPYWSEKLGKKTLNARQVSARGGNVVCESAGERVRIAGRAVRYMEGIIELDID
ncbi:MAG TPA: isomerase, partial [Gammaproteobacteria bacterium]|nr:isomerase [Gammaproteobacteria bacterium]